MTKAYINADLQPTASFVQNPDIDFEMGTMQTVLRDAVGDKNLDIIDATGIASALMGDSIATNPFMLGFAFQKGAIPLSLEALLRAIEINGAAIEMNKLAFTWGRLAAHDMSRVRSVLQFKSRAPAPTKSLDDIIATRAEFLTGYQDKAYADRYLAAVAKVRKAESVASPASTELTEAVAKNLFKLMSYKDEYEVARLYTDGSFAKKVSEKFDGDFTLKFHLAPPIFAQRDKTTRPSPEEGVRRLDDPCVPRSGQAEVPARRRARPVRPHRGAQHRTEAGRGISGNDRSADGRAEGGANSAAGEARSRA